MLRCLRIIRGRESFLALLREVYQWLRLDWLDLDSRAVLAAHLCQQFHRTWIASLRFANQSEECCVIVCDWVFEPCRVECGEHLWVFQLHCGHHFGDFSHGALLAFCFA